MLKLVNSDSNFTGIYKALVYDMGDGTPGVIVPSTCNRNSVNNVINSEKIKALWCAPNKASTQFYDGDSVWVMFESGDAKHPIILGFCGDSIREAQAGSGGGTYYSASNGTVSYGSVIGNSDSIYSESDHMHAADGLINYSNWCFPLLSYQTQDPFNGGGATYVGAPRNNGNRKHAGTDLITPNGSTIVACTDGVVYENNLGFYSAGSDALLVRNDDGSWITYGEGVFTFSSGARVVKGQILGKVAVTGMLHFEVYRGDYTGHPLIPVTGNNYKYVPDGYYSRRNDLVDSGFIVTRPLYGGN